jgi:serine/threonine protein kinase
MREGDTFGRYRIEATLGEGGMGRVFAAWDTMLQRKVALKVLHAEGDAESHARLLREARAAAALEHPNAVRVYDVGEVAGVSFLAMELLEGRVLRAFIGDGSVAVATKIRWLVDVARALDAAHKCGLVHRDVKPENVHVGSDGVVRVLDFGIARSVARDAIIGSITRDGVVLGTPRYMSPEQLTNEAFDGRADQFAWGVVAFELLAGKSPWAGDEAVKVVAQIMGTTTPSLEAIARISAPVAKVVARATEKDPKLRFASMGDAGAALEGAITGAAMATTVAAPSLVPTAPRTLPLRRTRARGAALGLVAIAAAAGAWAFTHAHAPTVTVSALDAASAIDSTPHMPAGLAKDARDAYAAAWSAYRAGNAGLASQRFHAAGTIDPSNAAAWLRVALTDLHRDPESARDAFRRAVDARSRLDTHDDDVLEAMRPLLQRDPPDLDASRVAFEALSTKWPSDPEVLWQLAEVHLGLGRFEDSRLTAQRSVGADRGFMQGWYDLIEATSYLGRFDESLRLIDECTTRQPEATDCLFERYYLRSHMGQCALLEGDARRATMLAPEAIRSQGFREKVFLALDKPAPIMDEIIDEWAARVPERDRARVKAQALTMVALRDGDFVAAEAQWAAWDKAIADHVFRPDHSRAAAMGAELAEERGDLVTAGKRAKAFLEKRDAWEEVPERDDAAVEQDFTMVLAGLARAGGAIDEARLESIRASFLREWDDVRFGYRPDVWIGAYAKPARTPEAARAGVAHLAEFGAIPPFTAVTVDYAHAGHALLLAGEIDAAIPVLRLAANSCDFAFDPIAIIRAALWWGEALEAKGDTKGACDAYGMVLHHWEHATPRSITADEARTHAKALGCAK